VAIDHAGRRAVSAKPMHKLIAAGLLLVAAPLLAQTDCDEAVRQAAKSYDLGLFEKAVSELAPCLKGRVSRARMIEARSLLARAYLQMDETEKAHKEISAILRLDSTFEASDPPRFAALVAQVRREEQATQVVSVSKSSESLREAPATVAVITADEIRRRGYLDLEQLLHDLPGFDVSRLNGKIYSNIYQRGYRSALNDRLMLLVDGVEQNELSSNTLYLSRQYPLTNIDRVEIIYGPASTMYGANAYTGVISIITRDPESIAAERSAGAIGQVTSGGYGSRSGDLTAGGRISDTVAWSVAANFQDSTERDLSSFPDWDYGYAGFDYASTVTLTGTQGSNFYKANCLQTTVATPYINCNDPTKITLNPAGVDLVRGLDAALISDGGLGFDDRAMNWSLYGKLRLANLTIGLQTWRSKEGIASQVRAIELAGRSAWTPSETALYVKYFIPLGTTNVNFFTRYTQTGIKRSGSQFEYLHNYAEHYLTPVSLVPPCRPASDPKPQRCPPGPAVPWVETVTFGSVSTQIRSELNATFERWERVKAVGGLELAKSTIQSQFDQAASGPGQLFHTVADQPQQIEHTDVALYGQGAWKPRRSLKLVLAGRVTHNQIDNKPGASGFGTLFTPRAAVIYSPPGKLVLKAIYSEAFKDPTDAEKFGVLSGVNDYPSLGLKPERVRNGEVSAGWEPSKNASLEAAVYEAHYSGVVGFVPVPACAASAPGCQRYANRDKIRIRGAQITGRYAVGAWELWGNYTYADPYLTNPPPQDQRVDPLRVADIAADHFNAGVDWQWRDRWSAGLRAHYVGARQTGAGTTESRNPFTRMEAYQTADATFSDSRLIPGVTLQLAAYNLLDKQYYDPATDPVAGVPRVLQAGRTFYLRLIVAVPRRSR